MDGLLESLGIASPIVAAPMAGGPSTTGLVVAAAGAGSLGFLAAGYRTAAEVAAQIRAVRSAGVVTFGVNVFAPSPEPVTVDPAAFRLYAQAVQAEGEPFGLALGSAAIVEHDDAFTEKVDLLVADPVPVVSFTFGAPGADVVARLRRAGSLVVQTVTTPGEARAAAEAGVDALVVQAAGAGAHSGTFTPLEWPLAVPLPELLQAVTAAVGLPVVAAGGIGTAADVRAALSAGAVAVMVGTALLRTDESGASAVHKAALGERLDTPTVLTRAFSGRPARALRNGFVARHHDTAPSGYPAVHYLTAPLRRAAAAAGDGERVNLWAGTGFRHATTGPAAGALARLAP